MDMVPFQHGISFESCFAIVLWMVVGFTLAVKFMVLDFGYLGIDHFS